MSNTNVPTNYNEYKFTASNLRYFESFLLEKLNNFNTQYSNYKKYLYNSHHNVEGDNSQKFLNNNNTPISQNDFPDIVIGQPIKIMPIYIDLVNNISIFNYMLSSVIRNPQSPSPRNVKELQNYENTIVKMRSDLDRKLNDLNEVDGSIMRETKRHLDASIVTNILFTALATSLIYYIAVYS